MKNLLIILLVIIGFVSAISLYIATRPEKGPSYDTSHLKNDAQKLAFILDQFETYGPDHFYKLVLQLDLGNIYSKPESELYNPKEAKRNYFRQYSDLLLPFTNTDKCIEFYSNIPEKLVTNKIHVDVLQEFIKICSLSDKDLFDLAEDFEIHGKRFFMDRYIAYRIYFHLQMRQSRSPYNPDLRHFEKTVHDKIKRLRGHVL